MEDSATKIPVRLPASYEQGDEQVVATPPAGPEVEERRKLLLHETQELEQREAQVLTELMVVRQLLDANRAAVQAIDGFLPHDIG